MEAYGRMNDAQKQEAVGYLDIFYKTDQDFRHQIDKGGFPRVASVCSFDKKP